MYVNEEDKYIDACILQMHYWTGITRFCKIKNKKERSLRAGPARPNPGYGPQNINPSKPGPFWPCPCSTRLGPAQLARLPGLDRNVATKSPAHSFKYTAIAMMRGESNVVMLHGVNRLSSIAYWPHAPEAWMFFFFTNSDLIES